ncbi:hypothetical protein F4805DRAFT_433112 [Annulohypoxylon moriforme]|nr:hypothetical protein F4805DRAFT_433112 [Annulohypoxylon moriforme]
MAKQANPQSFEDSNYFPSFNECPLEHMWDDRYLVDLDPEDPDSAGMNKKHWCLLGEIIQADTFIRPRLVAKDRKGSEFVVAFYPDDEDDMPRLLKNFKVGNTVAIFYPVAHGFADGTIGVRVEDSDEVIIIPLSLAEVFAMNKEVVKYVPTDGAPQKCYSCNETTDKLLKCGGCESAFYCNKECQTTGWKDKNHKRFCKVLKDKNVKWMQYLNYGVYNGSISFS